MYLSQLAYSRFSDISLEHKSIHYLLWDFSPSSVFLSMTRLWFSIEFVKTCVAMKSITKKRNSIVLLDTVLCKRLLDLLTPLSPLLSCSSPYISLALNQQRHLHL